MRCLLAILLYLLLPILTPVNGFNYIFDPERCRTDATIVCFVRGSCVNGQTQDLVLLQKKTFVDGSCDVIVQIRAYTEYKFRFMIQINSTTEELNPSFGIELSQDAAKFTCNRNSVKAVPSKFKIELFGDSQTFIKQVAFCSFILTSDKSIELAKFFKGSESSVKIVYATVDDSKHELSYTMSGNDFWATVTSKCNPDDITSDDSMNYDELLRKVDTAYAEIQCENDEQLILTTGDSRNKIDKLTCKGDLYKYPSETDPLGNKLPLNSQFALHCSKKFCSLCPDLGYKTCNGCAQPSTSTDGTCRTATCPMSNKWRLADRSVIETVVQCNQSEKSGQERTSGWFMTIGSERREITEASCYEDTDCVTYSNLNFTCPAGDCVQATILLNATKINCTDGYELKFGKETGSMLTCNPSNGSYSDVGGAKVDQNSNVYCQKIKDESDVAPQTGSMALGLSLGISVPLILAVIGIVLFIRWKRSKTAKTDTAAAAAVPSSANPSAASTPFTAASAATPAAASPVTAAATVPETPRKEDDLKTAILLIDGSNAAGNSSGSTTPRPVQVNGTKAEVKEKEPPVKSPEKPNLETDFEVNPEFTKLLTGWNGGKRITRWNNDNYMRLCNKFMDDCKNNIHAVQEIAAFRNHAAVNRVKEFGSLFQFFYMYKAQNYYLSPRGLELVFRLCKIFINCIPSADDKRLRTRLTCMVAGQAYDLSRIVCHGIKDMQEEDRPGFPDLKQLRSICLRIVLWNNSTDNDVTGIIRRGVEDIPEHYLGIRLPVFWYAVHHADKERRLRKMFYKELDREFHWESKPIGNLRQHLLFALCSSRNTELVREIMAVVHEKDPSKRLTLFTPTDILFAFQGATDDPTCFPVALQMLKKYALSDVGEFVQPVLEKAGNDRSKMQEVFAEDCKNLCTVMAECAIGEQALDAVATNCAAYLKYSGAPADFFDLFKDRAKNLETLTTHKDRSKWLDEALTCCCVPP